MRIYISLCARVNNLLPNMTAKFCDENAEEVPTGVTGELYLKGPNVFRGYLNSPLATSECLSADGWFRTGDLGHIDTDGNFFITDRAKELIKYKGFQVAPAEMEGLLLSHISITDVAVIGVYSDEDVSELPRAYVVLSPSAKQGPAQAREIMSWLGKRVAPYKKLRGGVEFVDSIPKNPSGKILRRVLLDRAKAQKGLSAKSKL